LRCIFHHCSVQMVRLIPQDFRALPAKLLRNHQLLELDKINLGNSHEIISHISFILFAIVIYLGSSWIVVKAGYDHRFPVDSLNDCMRRWFPSSRLGTQSGSSASRVHTISHLFESPWEITRSEASCRASCRASWHRFPSRSLGNSGLN